MANPAEVSAYERLLPTATGFRAKVPVTVSTTSVDLDLNSAWGGVSKRLLSGGFWVTIQAPAGITLAVINKLTADGAVTAATAANGKLIDAGDQQDFYVTAEFPVLAILGGAAGTAYVQPSSRNVNFQTPA